ncbi:MAG: hypothetical protein AB4911_04030 [Oscillochloridaceae bacterium umkhey_bin13]
MRRVPPWLLVLLGYLALGIALTWPLLLRMGSDLPGDAHKDGLEDAYQNVWNLWWTVEALSRPTNLWATDMLFHPDGPNLLFHTLSPINTLMVAPVTALFGPLAGFNAVALLSFGLGGLGMWLLARQRVGDGPALLAGAIYVASPFHMAALVVDGQLQIFAHHWLPWYIYFLLETLNRQSPPSTLRASFKGFFTAEAWPRHALLAGFALTLVAWGDWYYTLFLLIFTAGVLLWRLWRSRGAALHSLVTRLTLVAAFFSLGAGPLVAAMLIETVRTDYVSELPPTDPWRLAADPVAYLVPQRLHAFWGSAPWAWGVSFEVNRRFYLGLIAGLLAALALWKRPAARPWGLAVLGFGVLSLGSSLRINGAETGIPLPYALIAELPIVSLTRQPDRFNVLVTVALGMLAAYGAAVLLAWLRPRSARLAPLALVALLGLVLLDYWPSPITTRTPHVPLFLAQLPAEAGALIEYPFHPEITYRDAERMRFQTVHGQPISGGYHSRAFPQPQLGLPVLRDLRAGSLGGDIVLNEPPWAAALSTVGYSHIIGYRQQPLGPRSLRPEEEPAFRALVEAGLGVTAPSYEDEWMLVYDVPVAAPAPIVQIRTGWGPIEQDQYGTRFRWLAEGGELGLIVPQAGTYRLSFEALPAGGPRTLQLEQAGRTSQLALEPERRSYHLLLELPAGRTILQLRTIEPATSGQLLEGNGDLRPISVRVARVRFKAIN